MKKYSALIGIIIFSIVCLLVVVFNYQSSDITVSKYAVMNSFSLVSFCVLGCISAIFIFYGLVFYLPKKWGLGTIYKIIASLFSASFFWMCAVPCISGMILVDLHNVGSYAMLYLGLTLIIFWLIRLWREYNVRLKIINGSILLAMLTIFSLQIFQYDFLWHFILYIEMGVVVIIFTQIILLIFDKPKDASNDRTEG